MTARRTESAGRRGKERRRETQAHLVSGVNKLAAATYHALKAVISCGGRQQSVLKSNRDKSSEGRRDLNALRKHHPRP